MDNKKITNIKKNATKALLRKEFNFKTITQAKKFYAVNTAEEAYTEMMNDYNFQIDLNKQYEQKQKAKLAREAKKVKIFIINVTLGIKYKSKSKTGPVNISKEYVINKIVGPITGPIKTIKNEVNSFNIEDSIKIQTVISYDVKYMDEKIKTISKSKSKQLMKRSFALKCDWLKYSNSISKMAYQNTDDKCVYYQISQFLLNPPTGNPTKFINSERTSEEALFGYFKSLIGEELEVEDYSQFNIKSGVSTEMVAKLCKDIKRNMYAYDADNKMFNSVTCNTSKNYCPIIFYKANGHMYLIDDAKTIRSVAECNKTTAKKINTSSIESEETKLALEIFHIDEFPLEAINDLECGIYLLQQSNLNEEVIKYITTYNTIPKTRNRDNVIVSIEIRENVYIACDTNYGTSIEYNQIKNVAIKNEIEYINEGVGSVICSLLKGKDIRKSLTQSQKTALNTEYKNCCAECKIKTDTLQYDHITPLSCGGLNDVENIQPLCVSCHKEKTAEENRLGIYGVKDDGSSCFSDVVVNNVINTSHFKSYQFVEKVIDYEGEAFKIDMKKCRRNIALNCEYNLPVYSVMDKPYPFSGNLGAGFYYIETDNIFPFRGAGWYCEPLVLYGLKNNLINTSEIKLEFKPYKQLPNDYFVKHIETLLKAFECEPSLQKLCVNAYIGLFGKTIQTASFSKFSLCPYEASDWWSEKRIEYDVFIKNHKLENDEMLYEGIFKQDILQESSHYPLYSYILQLEALELHKLESIIINEGGVVLDRNTDAIRYKRNTEIDIKNYFWDTNKQVLKYDVEDAKPLKCEHLPKLKRHNALDICDKFNLLWTIENDYEIEVEAKAKEIVDSNKSIHIDGRAGTGKTFLANKVIEEIKKQGKKHIAFSPTNKGARLVGGKTIHSVYYKFHRSKKNFLKMLENVEYIFIDEVSMMIEKFYQLFMMTKRTFDKIKFIIVGDFAQLAPVNDRWTGDYKNSVALWSLCEGNRLQLNKCRRANKELFELCKNAENIDVSQFEYLKPTYLNLAYTHSTRIRINNKCMERFIKENNCSYTEIKEDPKNPKSQFVKLSVGMPVIAHTTNKKMDILNSEKFVVKSIIQDKIIVIEDEREIKINVSQFNSLFYLGFCITIHASQGETFNETYTIYDWNFSHFCERAKYVALSRATHKDNIQIIC